MYSTVSNASKYSIYLPKGNNSNTLSRNCLVGMKILTEIQPGYMQCTLLTEKCPS